MARTFSNIDQVKRYYFPETYEREKQAAMSPKELGRYLARKAGRKIRKALQNHQ